MTQPNQTSPRLRAAFERLHDRQRESGCHGGIHCVTTGPHDLHTRAGRQFMHAYHDRLRGMNRVGGGREGRNYPHREQRHQ